MQKLLAQIEKSLTSEAWKGARLDEATRLVVEYCYRRQGPIDVVVRDASGATVPLIDVDFSPSIERIFLLTAEDVFVLTEDFLSVSRIKISFGAVSVAFDPIRRRLLLLRSSASTPYRSIVSMDASGTATFFHRELGFETFNSYDAENLHIDATNGDLYVFCTSRGRYRLSRFSDGHTIQTHGTKYERYDLCAHDGAGVILFQQDKRFVRFDRNLSQFPTSSSFLWPAYPRFVSWSRDLVFSDQNESYMMRISTTSGETRGVAVTPFTTLCVWPSRNGTVYFVDTKSKTIHIAEPSVFLAASTLTLDSS